MKRKNVVSRAERYAAKTAYQDGTDVRRDAFIAGYEACNRDNAKLRKELRDCTAKCEELYGRIQYLMHHIRAVRECKL